MGTSAGDRPRIIIVGAGFGGLFAARRLAQHEVDVLLIDRNNFHTFTPLLYQVATCALDPSEIAYPVRAIFRKRHSVQFLLGEVVGIDCEAAEITIRNDGLERHERYDYLILAGGSRPTYFGMEHVEEHSLVLRTLGDAVDLRNHILRLFERATWTENEELREALTTIVVVGGGPTGLETAGPVYELYNHLLDREYIQSDLHARVVLVEMRPHLLDPYPEALQEAAVEQLRSLGVEVMLGGRVIDAGEDYVELEGGTVISTHTLVWSTGVRGSLLAEMLGVPLRKDGRVTVGPTLEVCGREGIYAVGDMAFVDDGAGWRYPMMIPVAQQQGAQAADNILARIAGRPERPFRYYDRGLMATIGRRRAVVYLYNRLKLKGFIAWLGWLGFHLITLMGFRNRLNVFINWVWNYFTFDRSVRLILERSDPPEAVTRQ